MLGAAVSLRVAGTPRSQAMAIDTTVANNSVMEARRKRGCDMCGNLVPCREPSIEEAP